MPQSGAQQMKVQGMQTVRNYVYNKEPVEPEALIARLEIELGLSEGKAQDWLEKLETGGYIDRDENGQYVSLEDEPPVEG